MKTLLIIDTFNLLFRSYYAMRSFQNAAGEPIGMLMGLANRLDALRSEDFAGVVFAADSAGGSFRNELHPEYKANRKELEPALRAQIPVALRMLANAGYCLLERPGYEADDIIASLAAAAPSLGFDRTVIASTDKDLFCLLNERTQILSKDQLIGPSGCVEKFGVRPDQMRDYLALIGDSADNFKGVPGVGPAAAKRLLGEFGTLEGVYENLSVAGTKGLIKKLSDGQQSALLSQKLATLVSDLPMEGVRASEDLARPYARLAGEFERWGLFKHARQASALAAQLGEECATGEAKSADGAAGAAGGEVSAANDYAAKSSDGFFAAAAGATGGAETGDGAGAATGGAEIGDKPAAYTAGSEQRSSRERSATKIPFSAHLIDDEAELFAIIEQLPGKIGFDTETTGLERGARCVGFSFAAQMEDGAHAYYVPVAHIGAKNISQTAARSAILALFSRTVVGHNLLFDFRICASNFGTPLPVKFIDSMLLAWIADSTQRVGLDAQTLKLFAHKNVAFDSLVPKGSHFGELQPSKAYFYAAEDAITTLKIAEFYEAALSREELGAAVGELAFAKVLFAMQEAGICANAARLKALEAELEGEISVLEQQIYAAAGREFNAASPKQVAEVLYDDLGLPAPKNRSTAESVLKTLEHPIIAPLLALRAASKVQGTYVRPLLALAGRAQEDFCIHASFLQHGTATGRLACAQPNLQNIPTRGRWGAKIKNCFIARPGRVFVGLDYSQIELRMLAHFSGDEALREAFVSGADIHAQTALECFGDASKRQLAKAINFGLIYGMGARTLAADLGIETKEAKRYIEAYFARYPLVQKFFAYTKQFAREHGFICTLAGRRRYFRYGANARENAAHDRECINSVLQGSAADLIKAAMVKAHEQLLGEEAALVLQVHDELIFEVAEEAAEGFAQKAAAIMQNAAALRVPLATSSAVGKTLADLMGK